MPEITLKDFAALVEKCRDAQKNYFANRGSSHWLQKAKELERMVDKAVLDMKAQDLPKQARLF